jgi:hypothetical protein
VNETSRCAQLNASPRCWSLTRSHFSVAFRVGSSGVLETRTQLHTLVLRRASSDRLAVRDAGVVEMKKVAKTVNCAVIARRVQAGGCGAPGWQGLDFIAEALYLDELAVGGWDPRGPSHAGRASRHVAVRLYRDNFGNTCVLQILACGWRGTALRTLSTR